VESTLNYSLPDVGIQYRDTSSVLEVTTNHSRLQCGWEGGRDEGSQVMEEVEKEEWFEENGSDALGVGVSQLNLSCTIDMNIPFYYSYFSLNSSPSLFLFYSFHSFEEA
jgi:hypothetical protein